MSDKKKLRMAKAEAEAKIARNEAVIPRYEAVITQDQIHIQGLALLHAAAVSLLGDSESVTLDPQGDDLDAERRDYLQAVTGLLVAMRNSEIKEISSDLNFHNLARNHEIDLDSIPKRGEKGGDIEFEDWLEWMVERFGPVPEVTRKVSTMETRMFQRPPSIIDVAIGFITVDDYLLELLAWSEEVKSKVTPVKITHGEGWVEFQSHGARKFCAVLSLKIRECQQARDDQKHFGVHLALIERNLEKWRRARIAASGKKGRPKKPHTDFFQLAWNYEYETFDSALDFLDDITNGCTFDVDREKETIRIFPDEDDEPYYLSFAAARKAFGRTH